MGYPSDETLREGADPPTQRMRQESIAAELYAERARQDAKFGPQDHGDFILWSTVLAEECGEFAKAALHHRFGGPEAANMRSEAIQCAAVAMAIVEHIDAGDMRWEK